MKYLFLVVLAFTFFNGFTQEKGVSEKYLKYERKEFYHNGFLVKNHSDTIWGLIKPRIGSSEEFSSFWFVNKNGRKDYIEPLEVTAFSFKKRHFISSDGSFFYVVLRGKTISLLKNVTTVHQVDSFKYFFLEEPFSIFPRNLEKARFHIRINNSDELILINRKNFNEVLPSVLNSCLSLIEKINNDEYSFIDIEKVIRHYDNCN